MIYISKQIETEINSEGEKAYPNECCGVLFGVCEANGDKILHQIKPINNSFSDEEQYHRFLITPEDMIMAERKARELKLDILGFYHSHPDSSAKPSDYDKNHALPFYSYLITSVEKGKAIDFTSWELSEDRTEFKNETIERS